MRKVYLKAGYAYIPHHDIVAIVLNDFRTRISKALAVSVNGSSLFHTGVLCNIAGGPQMNENVDLRAKCDGSWFKHAANIYLHVYKVK